jgi:hypothetical protein
MAPAQKKTMSSQQRFPPGWDEERVLRVLDHYEQQAEEEAVAEDEIACEGEKETVEDALMVLPYDPRRVEDAGRHFDETVRRIQAQEFAVTTPPRA